MAVTAAVNLALRLEGLNKPYHSHIIISEFTKTGLNNSVILEDGRKIRYEVLAQT